MGRIVATAGDAFTDIDALSSSIAYAELLTLEGVEAVVVLPGPTNESVPKFLLTKDVQFETKYLPESGDRFAVLDVSDVKNIARFVEPEAVYEIIDHHPGFTEYWQDIGVRTQIEQVGAAATQIIERWQEKGRLSEMKQSTRRLLAAGILDNTLNFTAETTDSRDRAAYAAITGDFPSDWAAHYFRECQKAIDADTVNALLNDTKIIELAGFTGSVKVGQLALWDTGLVLRQLGALRLAMSGEEPWFMNLISIGEKRNYVVAENDELQDFLVGILGGGFEEEVLITDRLWLRKEIMQAAIERALP